MLKNREDQIQAGICKFLDYSQKVFFAIPNGYKKSRFEQYKAKLTGLKSGVPDLFIAEPAGGYSGLWIEVKSEKGKLQKTQKEWIQKLKNKGYRVEVVYSFDEFENIFNDYFKQ